MRILIVSHNFPPDGYGGVEVYSFGLAKELVSMGHAVSVLYPREVRTGLPECVEEQPRNGIRVFRLHSHKAPSVRIYGLNIFRQARYSFVTHSRPVEDAFKKLLDGNRFDIVHFHGLHHHLPLSLLEVARTAGLPSCITLHDAWLICPRTHLYIPGRKEISSGPSSVEKCTDCIFEGALPFLKTRVREMIAARQRYAREILDGADMIAAPSRFIADRFESNGFARDRIQISPLGIAPIAAFPGRRSAAGVVFGAMGAIHRLKNTLHLVDSFKKVAGTSRLILWGNGNRKYIRMVEKSLRKDPRIEYRGPYTPEQIPGLLSELDVVVIPSLVESYSLVAREALAGGVPVLASNIGGIPEIIDHGVNGLLFDPSSAYDLSQRLQELSDDPAMIERLRAGIKPPKTIGEDASEWANRYIELAGRRSGHSDGH